MNLISALLLFLGCTMCGFLSAYRLGARVRGINAVISDVKRIQSRMEYSSASISRILEQLDTSPISGLWMCMIDELNRGATVYDAWCASYDKTRTDISMLNALASGEVDITGELFSELGSVDIDSQRRYFAMFFERMETELLNAQTNHKNRGRVFRGIGTLGGVALAILVI